MQGVERPQAPPCGVTPGKLGADVKHGFRNCDFTPQAIFTMKLKACVVLIAFAARKRPSKNVLFHRMCPFGNVKGSQRYDPTSRHKALSHRGVRVGYIERYKEAGVSVGAQ